MSEDASGPPDRRQEQAQGPARRVLPWAAVIVSAVLTFRGATGEMSAIFIITGPALATLGIVMFFVYRWMATRGW